MERSKGFIYFFVHMRDFLAMHFTLYYLLFLGTHERFPSNALYTVLLTISSYT